MFITAVCVIFLIKLDLAIAALGSDISALTEIHLDSKSFSIGL